jgi:hypothetical protein
MGCDVSFPGFVIASKRMANSSLTTQSGHSNFMGFLIMVSKKK